MNPIQPRFGNQMPLTQYQPGLTGKMADAGHALFQWSPKIKEKAQTSGPIMRRLRRFAADFVTDADFRETPVVKLGKRAFKIIEPPKAAMLLLLYPFTIGPRLAQAIQRDPTKTEVGDVLRRDLTAITIFLFLLKPLGNTLGTLLEKVSGMKLVEREHSNDLIGKMFKFSELEKNYHVGSAEQLRAILQEGNEDGMQTALKKLKGYYKAVLPKLPNGDQVLKQLDAFQESLEQALKLDKSSPAFKAVTTEAFGHLNGAEEQFSKIMGDQAKAKGAPWAARTFNPAKVLPNVKDFMAHHAKVKTLPVHILSFATVVVAIGWFPVWFNDVLSRKKRAKREAANRTQELANFNPQLTYQALKQTSRLSNLA